MFISCACHESGLLQVLARLRVELFRSLLLQKIEFFDVHSANELTSLISRELDSVRDFVFRNVARDRGPRAALEASSRPGTGCMACILTSDIHLENLRTRPLGGAVHEQPCAFLLH